MSPRPEPTIRVAATHDGSFHADDALAAAMLRIAHPGVAFVRTRDPAAVAAADVAFDVGAAYDPARMRYDHHQRERPLRPDGTPYAACGLVWLHHGDEALARLAPDPADAAHLPELRESIAEGLVRSVDAVDNGGVEPAASDLACLVSALCPAAGEDLDADAAFLGAVDLCELFLRRLAIRGLASLRAVDAFARAVAASPDPRLVVLDAYLPWARAVRRLGLPGLLYVVHPDGTGREWLCAAVGAPERGAYALRRPLPAAWGGLRDAAFQAETGVADGTFCHPNLFLCGASTRESAVRLAGLAIGAEA